MNGGFLKFLKLVKKPKYIFNKIPFRIDFKNYLEFLNFKLRKEFLKFIMVLFQCNFNLYNSISTIKKKKNFFSISKKNLWVFQKDYFKFLKRGEKKFFFYLYYKKFIFFLKFIKKNKWQQKKFLNLTRYLLFKKLKIFFGKKKFCLLLLKNFLNKRYLVKFKNRKKKELVKIKNFFPIFKYIKLRRYLFKRGNQSVSQFNFIKNLLSLSFTKNSIFEKKFFINLKLIVTLNNFFVIISNEYDFILFKISGGFYERGSRKKNDLTLETSLIEEEEGALEFLIEFKKSFPHYKYIKFFYSCPRSKYFFKTLLYNFRQVNRDLNFKILEVKNIAPLAHNGCRRKKKRRV
jgi:hypothetical protein